MFKQGDIVFVPFPFTDNLEISKNRPVVILSKNAINIHSYIVAKVTSVIRNDAFTCPIFKRDIVGFPMEKPSEIRTNEIMTIKENLIVRKLGSLTKDALEKLSLIIQDNFIVE